MKVNNTTDAGTSQPQCQFFVVRKKRLCRMTVRPGRQYCGEHEPQPSSEDQQIDKRVPCPNDPKHTCYVSKLEQHLVKCNARAVEDPPYIVRNINAPESDDSSPRVPLKDVPTETLQRLIDKVNALYEKHVEGSISTFSPPAEPHAAVAGCMAQADRTHASRRHLRQASRLMQLAEAEGLVADDSCYLELGAGKGMLSYYVGVSWCGAAARSRVLCVDRAALRHKRDNRLTASAGSRVRADLRHLAPRRLPAARAAARLVGLAKHLCGVATDYALRCMARAAEPEAGAAAPGAEPRGVLVATCCHHRCEAPAYVGRRALQELGITTEDLNIMFGIVSWATCGDGRSRERRARAEAHRDGHTEHCTDTSEMEHADDATHVEDKDQVITSAASDSNDSVIETNKVEIEMQARAGSVPARARGEPDRDGDTAHHTDANEMEQDASNINLGGKDQVFTSKASEGNESVVEASKAKIDKQTRAEGGARAEVGRRAKALLDHGRALYLRECGFKARLCYYVPAEESPENLAIVATREPATTCL